MLIPWMKAPPVFTVGWDDTASFHHLVCVLYVFFAFFTASKSISCFVLTTRWRESVPLFSAERDDKSASFFNIRYFLFMFRFLFRKVKLHKRFSRERVELTLFVNVQYIIPSCVSVGVWRGTQAVYLRKELLFLCCLFSFVGIIFTYHFFFVS